MRASLADRWRIAVPSLAGVTLRSAYLRAELDRQPFKAFAEALNDLAGSAEQADPVAREVLAAAVPLLADPALAGWVSTLRRAATAAALHPLGRMLRGGSPAPDAEPEADDRVLVTSSAGRALTLGERRSLGRRPPRALLDKLLRDPHPLVIRNVLGSARVTEDDVIRAAARRPASAAVITEIARHPMWSTRPRVRMAIVQNPGAPESVTVPMLRLLIRPELAQVAAGASVPAAVRAAAQELLERRPPVPEPGEKGAPQ